MSAGFGVSAATDSKDPLLPGTPAAGASAVLLAAARRQDALIMIEYSASRPIGAEEFIDLLRRSTLGERRPVDDRRCMQGMAANADLIVTA